VEFQDPLNGHMTVTALNKAVRVGMKQGIEDRLQQEAKHLLRYFGGFNRGLTFLMYAGQYTVINGFTYRDERTASPLHWICCGP
jgi:hypothetical protein